MPNPPLRAVLLYSRGHLGSAIVFNLLRKRELEIVGVVRAAAWKPASGKSANFFSKLFKTGWRLALMLFWQRLVKILTYGLAILVYPFRKNGFLPGWLLAHRLKIPVFACRDVNAPETLAFIESLKPDLIISAYFHQILKSPVIALPKIGVLNIHPGWLPHYRGAMNYFWVLKNDEKEAGVSLHWIDEGIDTGPLVARARFHVTAEMTQHQVLMKTAILGSRLLQQAVRRLRRGETLPPISISQEDARYYSLPDGEAFDAYFKKRRFFRIRNILRVLFGHGQ